MKNKNYLFSRFARPALLGTLLSLTSPLPVQNQELSSEYFLPEISHFTIASPDTFLKVRKDGASGRVESIVSGFYQVFQESLPYLSPKILLSLVLQESSGDSLAVSNKGARGLMQLTRSAWIDSGRREEDYLRMAKDPKENVHAGLDYLIWIGDYCETTHPSWESLSDHDKRRLVLASYNGGSNRLKRKNWNIDRMPKETRMYVDDIENRARYL